MATRAWGILAIGLIVSLSACGTDAVVTPSVAPSASSSAGTSSPSATPTVTPTPDAVPSDTAAPDDPPPAQVVGLTATVGGGSGEVLVRWSQNDGDVVEYIVLRALVAGGPSTQIGTVTPEQVEEFEVVPFVDSSATVGYYRVRAVDAAGQLGPSSIEVCGASVGHNC